MTEELQCWKCGAAVVDEPLPLAREAECRHCRAQLHVCRMCEFYDESVAGRCREPVADEVHEKERANFCDYFVAAPGAFVVRDDSPGITARRELDQLFSGDSGGTDNSPDDADEARRELDRLFGADES